MILTVPFNTDGSLLPRTRNTPKPPSGVYAISRNRVCVYIGASGNMRARWGNHRTALRRGNHTNKKLLALYKNEEDALWSFHQITEELHATSMSIEKALIRTLRPVANIAIYDVQNMDLQAVLDSIGLELDLKTKGSP